MSEHLNPAIAIDPFNQQPVVTDPELHITLMSGPHDGQIHGFKPISQFEPLIITIGRRIGCHIVLDYDAQVSRVHARLIYDPRDAEYFLEDAESRNGTFVGQTRLRARIRLEPGTMFRIGRTWLRLDPISDPLNEKSTE